MGNDNCPACAYGASYQKHTCDYQEGTGTTGPTGAYTFDDYQEATADTAVYPEKHTGNTAAINYTILGLVGEAGELAGHWKKFFRDGDPNDENHITNTRTNVIKELGDVLWYASQLANELGISLGDVAGANLQKLSARKASGTIRGSGDNR